MRTIQRLLGCLIGLVVVSVGLVAGPAPAHADNVVYKNGPDQYGTFNDIRYGTSTWKGYFGQVTWSHNISMAAKEKWRASAGGSEGAHAVAVFLCARFPTPPGQATCVYYLTRNLVDFKDTIAHVNNTTYADRCISFRWYAAAIWNAGRSISPVRCWTAVDYCASCGYGGSGGGGGGGGGGSWRRDSELSESHRTAAQRAGRSLDESERGVVGSGGGGSW